MKIAILWLHLPGYACACIMELHKILGSDTWFASLGELAPYLANSENFKSNTIKKFFCHGKTKENTDKILQSLTLFKPDIFIVSGWNRPVVRLLARHLKSEGVVTVCMSDAVWDGTIRQFVRCIIGRHILHECFDVMWVTGNSAVPLAHFAGFKEPYLWKNLLSADTKVFSSTTKARLKKAALENNWPKTFLFVGSFMPRKNIKGLINAYKIYRRKTKKPWTLLMAGNGPMFNSVHGIDGVSCLGWLEPDKIAKVMAKSGCFILPSKRDQWGIVVHEAACSGLPIIASSEVGSRTELVHDFINGRVVDPRKPKEIVDALLWVSEQSKPWILGTRSYEMSKTFNSRAWAEYLICKSKEVLKVKGYK